ncbi:MAG: LptF/LptG family permease [Acidobacteriota bacterium]
MKRIGILISRYLLQAIVPYFAFSWLLLSVILFAQQATRYSDIFFSVNLPPSLIWQLTLALIPNVIAFTCPMAILVGTIIGLSRMQGDSELIAIRAAGVGNFQITVPIVVLGILLSVFAFFVNLKGVPFAARMVRSVALQTAIKKLESPIEPGVFNSEVAGYTIYVKGGDLQTGKWKNIFIYNEDDVNGLVRLITSTNGRIDVTGESSELVLENATVSSFPKAIGQGKFISENIGEVRFAIKTRRAELIEKLSSAEGTPEELGLSDLANYAQNKQGSDRVEAEILWQRRIILSLTPLLFCLLGSAMLLRFNRGGRGFGIFLALGGLIGYYLFAFLGEQLARTGRLSVLGGGLIPIAASVLTILFFTFSRRFDFWSATLERIKNAAARLKRSPEKVQTRNFLVDLTTGLRDLDLLVNLLRYFLLTLGFLTAIFVIFTAFELWKFAGTIDGGILLLAKYLFYLLPFVYLQLAPSAAMIGTLATYVIKSRQNEIVTWTSAGQSVYRLLLPCFVLMLVLGFVNWEIQERIAPTSNQIQDVLREQIRSRGVANNVSGKLWIANDKRIYSFEMDNNASDNAKRAITACSTGCPMKNLSIFEFNGDKTKLQSVYRVSSAVWQTDHIEFTGDVEKTDIQDGKGTISKGTGGGIPETVNPFLEIRRKPSHMNAAELKDQIATSESAQERRAFFIALDKKYSTLVLPFIIALFTAPFALSLSRKGRVVTVGYAVGLWLLYTGVTGVFEQLGLNGILAPSLAIWGPLVIFSMLGLVLLSRVRT